MSIIDAALLILAGLFAGFINTLAGSGSLITLPLLMFLGLSPHQANATNRVAIFFQNAVAVRNFKQQGLINYKNSLFLVIPAIVGSIVGASIAVSINEKVLNLFIGSLLFVMFFVILFKPDRWVKAQAGQVNEKPAFWQIVIFFLLASMVVSYRPVLASFYWQAWCSVWVTTLSKPMPLRYLLY